MFEDPLAIDVFQLILLLHHDQVVQLGQDPKHIKLIVKFLGASAQKSTEYMLLAPTADLHATWNILMNEQQKFISIAQNYVPIELYVFLEGCLLEVLRNLVHVKEFRAPMFDEE